MPTLVHNRRGALGVWAVGLALAGFGCGAADSGAPPSPPPPPPPPAGVIATVTVDTLTRFQVMTGWEAAADAGLLAPDLELWRDDMIRLAVTDLGLNRLRLPLRNGSENPVDNYTEFQEGRLTNQEWRCKRYTTINDNSDPNVIAPGGFYWTEMDKKVEKLVLPMKQRLEAQGESLVLSLTYIAFISQCNPLPPYPHVDPAEYAEFILAAFLHLQQKYALVPNNVEVLLEPDNTGAASPWNGNGTAIGQAIVATGQRLAAAGFHPKFTVPSTKSLTTAITYFDDLIKVPGVLPFIGEIAYHRYGGVSDANLVALADRGRANGLKTAMLEHIGSGVEDLYKDILLGRASAWQQFTLAFALADDGAQYYVIVNSQPVLGTRSRYLRQYFRYVRLGAQRVGAVSDNSAVRPVAFVNQNGKTAVVIHVAGAGEIFVRGLRPGTYGTSVTTDAATGTELGNQVVGPFGTMVVAAPAGSVLTVYRK
jgi:hypothetical protein